MKFVCAMSEPYDKEDSRESLARELLGKYLDVAFLNISFRKTGMTMAL